jgi:DNA-directed RNA polymerase subunit N (RpoN/RPB10)
MRAEQASDPAVTFFLATDSPQVAATMFEEFGARVLQHPKKSLSRDDPEAIRDALIDLYCLANCRKLIGSYWSSFTDTAWEMRQIEHVIVDERA